MPRGGSIDDPGDPSAADVGINAFTGDEAARGRLVPNYGSWALGSAKLAANHHLLAEPANPADWTDDRVGWGVILPEKEGLDHAALARADDAPEPIRDLVKARKGKVLRYRAGTTYADWTLRDYAFDGDVVVVDAAAGMAPGALPMYLLIYGSPAEIPWHVQYNLQPVRRVGRLDLTGDGLANYVSALLNGWADSTADYHSPVVWAVDFGGDDITTVMREVTAEPLYTTFANDKDGDFAGATYVNGSTVDADAASLQSALETKRPLLVVTTSHGLTGPLNDPDAMREKLGLPVDATRSPVDPQVLLKTWQPDGAVWYAQACCSAGANSPSVYSGLLEPSWSATKVIEGVAALGGMVSPLPRSLLGASKPLRAFIGQVEPAFEWTMAFPPNGAALTNAMQDALISRMCFNQPVGLAMSGYYNAIATLLLEAGQHRTEYNANVGASAKRALDLALYGKVTAYDRAGTVILGDPTVAIPRPRG